MKMNILIILLGAVLLQSCVFPGISVDPVQASQTPHNKIFNNSKKGIVIFRGMSCPQENEGNTSSGGFGNIVARTKMFFASDCSSYKFVNLDDKSYYIKQLADSSGVKTTFSSEYVFYTVPAGKYYYDFSGGNRPSKDELLKSFSFEVKEGQAVYVGDFYYVKKDKKFKLVDNYEAVKLHLQNKIPVTIEKSLAKGSKISE
jgi:hypothetical protein